MAREVSGSRWPIRRRMMSMSAAFAFASIVNGCGGGSPSNSGAGAGGADGSAGAGATDGSSGGADGSGPCGGESELCCVAQCNPDLVCVSNFPNPAPPRCRHCGGNGEPCCPLPNACSDGLVCWQTIDSGNHCAPPRDGSPDPRCIKSCVQPGGQYCGRIGDNCGRFLDCGECENPDYTCGGAGISHVCGAPRDAGGCEVTICDTPIGSYCGVVGDGCGGAIDCGNCRPPGFSCGGGGIPQVCGAPPDLCTPVVCDQPTFAYCGRIGDGCGRPLDCGACRSGQICGELVPNVCGSPTDSIPPPPPPRDPPPPPPPDAPPPPNAR